ncbi:MAG TPA: RiPP maturation radical SAM C-methyltransferase [Longimicrobium sp.]|nr:RiPP maturation radical SAM C-methyltransferase [Longimicrobium sp.]
MNADPLHAAVPPCDLLLIVPPFAPLNGASLAAQLLQAGARRAGVRTAVLYANLHFAGRLGTGRYEAIRLAPFYALVGERIFARAAFGGPALGRRHDRIYDPQVMVGREGRLELDGPALACPSLAELHQAEALAGPWCDQVAAAVAAARPRVVGATTTFEQTSAAIALLERVKRLLPETVTVLGGANCEGEMADGIRSLGARVDYVFSGESDHTFPEFLSTLMEGRAPAEAIVRGQPCHDLDGLASPSFDDYFAQLEAFVPAEQRPAETWLPYETSRGCWWGQRHHCTFCGLNGLGIGFREKSPERVVDELGGLVRRHGVRQVFMMDNIMPHTYFGTLLPRLAGELPGLHVFYEQKANLTLDKLRLLHRAGVREIQPGIEALSSTVLKRMDKGVHAWQNVELLRHARALGITLHWNLLWGFPGEGLPEFEETAALLPLLRHLQPPSGLNHLSIDRFSPYHDRAEAYGISGLRPFATYADVFPPHADARRLAYHFCGDYESALYRAPGLLQRLYAECARWTGAWQAPETPVLHVRPIYGRWHELADTRGLPGSQPLRVLHPRQLRAALVPGAFEPGGEDDWMIEQGVVARIDGRWVPLATAGAELLAALEAAPAPARRAVAPPRAALPVLPAAAPG